MKNVLIIGENSYIGKSFYYYANEKFNIEFVSSRNEQWKNISFSKYDSILHCAGIAHVSQKSNMEQEYYKINRDLTIDVADKAKKDGASQFIFLSSMSVYSSEKKEINIDTVPQPHGFYGNSKLQAEKGIKKLSDDRFKVCVVRPPMVYGYGCKGNFRKLVKLAKWLPVFPNINNKRSMIYIENLCEFLCSLVDNQCGGIHLPQNIEYVNTTKFVKCIASLSGRNIITTKMFNPVILPMLKKISPLNKLFGDLTYGKSNDEYNIIDFKESVKRSIFKHSSATRITIVTSYYQPEHTPVSHYYEELAYDLVEYGCNVTVVTGIPTRRVEKEVTKNYAENPIEYIGENLKIIHKGPKMGEGKNFAFRTFYHLYRSYCIYRAAKKVETDVYIVCSTPPFLGVFGAWLAKKSKTIYDLQDIFPDTLICSKKAKESDLFIKALRIMEKYIYIGNTHIRTISSDMLNNIKEKGISENKISMVYNWVDEKKVVYIERENNPIFDILNIPRDGFYICYAGNIGLLQNLSTLISAAEILQKNNNLEPQFIIIGDGAWKKEMLKIIEAKNLRNVRVFPMQETKLVPLIYNLGDIGIVTIAKGVAKGSLPSKT